MGKKSTLGAKKKSTDQKKGDVSQKSPAKAKTRSKENKHIRGKTAPMTAETEKKEISMTDLILKKFEPWNTEALFRPDEDEAYLKNFAAPPFFTDADEKDAERMRSLLLNKFDMKSFSEKPVSGDVKDALSEQAAAQSHERERVGVSAEELVLKKFEAWKPETLFSAVEDEDYVKNFAAPPFFADADERETKRIAELLAEKFDIKSFPEKPVSIAELLEKKFEAWKPETLFSAGDDEDYVKNFAAPPFFADADAKETKRISELLAAKFDIKSFPEKPVSVEELLEKKFEAWKPGTLFSAVEDEDYVKNFAAPPFFGDADERETKRISDLLATEFDIKSFPEKPPEEIKPAVVETASSQPPETVTVQAEEKVIEEPAPAEKLPPEPVAVEVQAETPKPGVESTEEKAEQVTAHEPTEKIAEHEKAAEEAVAGYRPPVKRAEPPKKPETPEVSETKKGKDPMETTVKYFIAAIACAFVLIISASISNVDKYYLKANDGSLEIWQGNFAPLGEEMLVRLNGEKAPKAVKPVYEREEVFPLAFNYYLAKADGMLNQPDVPDLEKIRFYVNKAISFGTTEEIRNAAYERMKKIDLMTYLSQADIAASKGASADFQTALDYLSKAAPLVDKESSQAQLIARKIEVIKELMASLKAKQAEISATPAPAAAPAPSATPEPATAAPAPATAPSATPAPTPEK